MDLHRIVPSGTQDSCGSTMERCQLASVRAATVDPSMTVWQCRTAALQKKAAIVAAKPTLYGLFSLRRTKAAIIDKQTATLRTVQILLGRTKIERELNLSASDCPAAQPALVVDLRRRSQARRLPRNCSFRSRDSALVAVKPAIAASCAATLADWVPSIALM